MIRRRPHQDRNQLALSARFYHRVLKVSRTIADLASAETIAAAPGNSGSSSAVCDFSDNSQPLIKGNINEESERIYHMPGQQFYDATTIDRGAGERLFCTEDDALEAGWRKAKS